MSVVQHIRAKAVCFLPLFVAYSYSVSLVSPRQAASQGTCEMICPYLYYRSAKDALVWLEKAVGFTPLCIMPGEGDDVAHAELKLGSSAIMLATAKPEVGRCSPADTLGSGVKTPSATHSMYIAVSDFDAAYKRAKDAGASITKEPYDTAYGSRDFALTDPEGGLWYLGTYAPKVEVGQTAA